MSTLGKFIVVEGLDGTGKSEFTTKLTAALRSRKIRACSTRQPGGTPAAERIRNLIFDLKREPAAPGDELDCFTEALLFYAARNQLSAALIEPRIAAGEWVISDRHTWSTAAYQGINNPEIDKQVCIKPDMVIYLSAEVDTLLKRIELRGEEPSQFETEECLTLAKKRYSRMMQMTDNNDVYVIDTNSYSRLDAHFDYHVDSIVTRLLNAPNLIPRSRAVYNYA